MIDHDGQRRHLRVRDDIPVKWVVERLGLSGRGILRNLSVSGAMLEVKALMAVNEGLLVALKAEEISESVFVPPQAEVVWGKGAKEGHGYFFYGVQFKNPSAEYIKAIESRVEDKTKGTTCGLGKGIADISWGIR